MQKPEIPADETKRLESLKSLKILDTQSEERFDRVTRMASRVFDVPIALVSLVDENRQWFKSCLGLSASETDRDISFCGHAILGDEIFIIPDAALDERFADNPLVVNEPKIRFYAGCPLRLFDGSKLGTLCIIDEKPRTLSSEDIVILKDLASMVEQELSAVQLATMDELTNINNRRGFTLLAQQNLAVFKRQNMPASLVFFDLNKFKTINDQFGHAEGDRALIDFAQLLKNELRESDLFARLGGDEFVALLTNTSKIEAKDIVNRFKQTVEAFNLKVNREYDISFCSGIVEYDETKHQCIDTLLAESDALMYRQKKQASQTGNNSVHIAIST